MFFFSVWSFFHKHSRFTGQPVKGKIISLTSLCHFHPLYRHLNISQAITAESSLLHLGISPTQTGNLWFSSASCKAYPEKMLDYLILYRLIIVLDYLVLGFECNIISYHLLKMKKELFVFVLRSYLLV